MKNISYFLALSLLIAVISCNGQDRNKSAACIAFYNVENLFDTVDDPRINDSEFLPGGSNRWNRSRYEAKLKKVSEVISGIGSDISPGGPAVIGLSEIENRSVLEDLVKTPALLASAYGIVHFDGPDERGVDVALLYRPGRFRVSQARAFPLVFPGDNDRTRDQLVVAGKLDGETMYFIVNHWPSRSGGEEKSAPKRAAAARLCRHLCDSIYSLDPGAKIIVMGDFNDNPDDASMVYLSGTTSGAGKAGTKGLFNPMYEMFRKQGIGSLAYRDTWSLFDQILVSEPLLSDDKSTYAFMKARVFNKDFLTQRKGPYKGYPFRTFAGGVYQGGYSDHFPVYILLHREK